MRDGWTDPIFTTRQTAATGPINIVNERLAE